MAGTLINLSDSMITESVGWPFSHYLCRKQYWRAAVILTQLIVQPCRASSKCRHQVWKIAVIDEGWHCARYGFVNVYAHYTLAQPETLGLINNALPNKKNLKNVLDVHSIPIEIFNGKQRGQRLLCWPGFLIPHLYDTDNAGTSTDIIFRCIHAEAL